MFRFFHEVHSVPKFEIHTNDTLEFKIRYFLWLLPADHEIYNVNSQSFNKITVSNLIKELSSFDTCIGIDDIASAISFTEHSVSKIFSLSCPDATSTPLHQSKFYRHPSCSVLLSAGNTKCTHCIKAEAKEIKSLKRKESNLSTPEKLHASIKNTAPERIKLTLQNIRSENKALKCDIKEMKQEIAGKSIDIKDESLHNDLVSIMSNVDNTEKRPHFMKFFWDEQKKYQSATKTGVRYHPMIIRYCLALAAKSSSAYDDIRFDSNNGTGFTMLPSRRRLRDYKNYIRPTQGFNKDVINELVANIEHFSEEEKYEVLLLDEIKIQEDLVWDKHTGDLIGYVDLGNTELYYAALKKTDEIASHALVFLVRSIVNPMKFTLANFATKAVTATQLFPLFWKAVGILEERCKLKVMAVTSDGASANRTMYQMHKNMNHSSIASYEDKSIVYKTRNRHAEDDREIFFICDQPHVLKTVRNNIAHSGFNQSFSRLLWNDNRYLNWSHIKDLMFDDLELEL